MMADSGPSGAGHGGASRLLQRNCVFILITITYVMVVMRIRSLRDHQCPNSEPTGQFFLYPFFEASPLLASLSKRGLSETGAFKIVAFPKLASPPILALVNLTTVGK